MPERLGLEALVTHRAVKPEAELGDHHIVLRIRAAKTAMGPRPRLSAVLALDVSGSMGGEPVMHVVRSAQRIAEILQDTDRLGVVSFADAAHTVSPLRALTGEARREVAREVSGLSADGRTNISAALSHAAMLFPPRGEDERQIVLLMSDGQPNVGSSSPHALGEETRRVRARDVAVSTLGFGADHKEDVLIAIAEGGGGRYAFVSDPQGAQSSFARALGAQLDVVAERVELLLTPSEGVEIVRVLGDPRSSFGASGLRVSLQDAVAGDELNIVVELKMHTPREAGPWRAMKVELTWREPGTRTSRAAYEDVPLTVTKVGPFEADAEARAIVVVAIASELRTEALALAERGSYGAAAAILTKAKALIEAVPGFSPGATTNLNDAYETLVDDLAAMAKAPDAEAYRSYKKAAHDYNDFAQGGAASRARSRLSEASASAVDMVRRSVASFVMPHARLVGVGGPVVGVVHPLGGVEVVLGRMHDNEVVIVSPMVSKRHTRSCSRARGSGWWTCGR